MNGSIFIDTNLVLYALESDTPPKNAIARKLLLSEPWISPQVIFETLNVLLRKRRLGRPAALKVIQSLITKRNLCPEDDTVVCDALYIFDRYGLQGYDSKIVATALRCNAQTLYSEDMQDGMIIEGRLTIANPFKL